jgi:hypothetical protein
MAAKRILSVFLFALLAVGVYYGSSFVLRAQAQTSGISCSLPFEATVYAGPSTGTSLNGTFSFSFDPDGGITGTLAQEGQPDILVIGQAQGRSINLAFDLSTAENPGMFIFGVGTAIDPVDSELCGTISGGPFVGPMPGDSGDWGYAIGGLVGTNATKGAPSSNPAQDTTGSGKRQKQAASSKQPAALHRAIIDAQLFGQGDPFEADNKKKAEAAVDRQPVNFPSTNVQPTGFFTSNVQPTGF